jgi:Fe-S cluster assembly protein SufD
MTTAIKENQDVYLQSFRQLEGRAKAPEWLARLRTQAFESFLELGFPATRDEEWKYTNVAPIARTPFQPAAPVAAASVAEFITKNPLAELGCPRLVFVNGRWASELSSLQDLEPELKVMSLEAALGGGAAPLEEHLARYAGYAAHPFAALNTAFIQDGAWIEVPKRRELPKPIYLLYVTVSGANPAVTHPRNLILLGRESQATLIEGYLGFGPSPYLTNAVTEIVLGENSILDYVKFGSESETAFHLATVKIHQARNARAHATTVTLGARLTREDTAAVLDGEGAEATLNGLYVLTGEQHADNHTTLDHARPHGSSRELYKGILDGRSTGVFNGKIIVRQDAQKTDSKQSNKNLLLSEDAAINTKPQLEIYADDVKCTHGATIGQMDAEALFYLRSRGIGRPEARNLLTVAFANDVLDKIKYPPLRERLKSNMLGRLARNGP